MPLNQQKFASKRTYRYGI